MVSILIAPPVAKVARRGRLYENKIRDYVYEHARVTVSANSSSCSSTATPKRSRFRGRRARIAIRKNIWWPDDLVRVLPSAD